MTDALFAFQKIYVFLWFWLLILLAVTGYIN